MLRLLSLLSLLMTGLPLNAQDFAEKVAESACSCAQEERLNSLTVQERTIKLEYCIQKSIQVNKDHPSYQNLFSEAEVNQFANQVTEEMGRFCPTFISATPPVQNATNRNTYQGPSYSRQAYSVPSTEANTADLEDDYSRPTSTAATRPTTASRGSAPTGSYEGTFMGVSGTDLAAILVRDAGGRYQKFLWLEFFEGANMLTYDIESLKGRKVRISFVEKNTYSLKKRDYELTKIISGLELLN